MFSYAVTKVLPVEGDELVVGNTYPNARDGEILTIMAIVEPKDDGTTEEFDLIITRTKASPVNEALEAGRGT